MIDTPRMPASICNRFARGSERSFSQARIVLTLTPSRLASSAWLRPAASRAPVIRSPKVVVSASYQPTLGRSSWIVVECRVCRVGHVVVPFRAMAV
jgi:hypothetical protein